MRSYGQILLHTVLNSLRFFIENVRQGPRTFQALVMILVAAMGEPPVQWTTGLD